MARQTGAFACSLLVLLLFAGACTQHPLPVPEKDRVQRVSLAEPDWQKWTLCAVLHRGHCPDLSAPETYRSPQQIADFREFLTLLDGVRHVAPFQQKVEALAFAARVNAPVVDAKEESAEVPPGRIAYRVHDCWMVLYATDESGFPATTVEGATIRRLAVFCERERGGPGR